MYNKVKAILDQRGKVFNFTDIILQDDSDSNGPRLVYWNSNIMGPEPTEEELQ